jgi:hypothetical protein
MRGGHRLWQLHSGVEVSHRLIHFALWMNFNHVHVDCYVSFNNIQWLLIKVTGLRKFQRDLCQIFGSIKNEAYVVTTLPVICFW